MPKIAKKHTNNEHHQAVSKNITQYKYTENLDSISFQKTVVLASNQYISSNIITKQITVSKPINKVSFFNSTQTNSKHRLEKSTSSDSTETYVKPPNPNPTAEVIKNIIITGLMLYMPYLVPFLIKANEGKTQRYELSIKLLNFFLILLLGFILAIFLGFGVWFMSLGTAFSFQTYFNIVGIIFASLFIPYYVYTEYLGIQSYWF